MKTISPKPVTIPVEILSLKIAKLSEKLLLALYCADPKAKWVRRALSMTTAGLRKLIQRLAEKKLLTVDGARRVIRVPGLGGHFVPDSSATKSEEKVTVPASKPTAFDTRPLVVPAELLEFRYQSQSNWEWPPRPSRRWFHVELHRTRLKD